MKCTHCKEELPQDDYNICPFCAKPIKSKNVCPHCNKELDQADYNICPFCAKSLEIAPPPPIPKKVTKKQQLPPKEGPPPPTRPPRTSSESPPVEVVVKVQNERKDRRINPIWLLILLLLLLVCCCGLLLTKQVEVPEVIAPQVDPIIENMRESLSDFIGGRGTNGGEDGDRSDMDGGGKGKQPADEGSDCEDLIDQMLEADLTYMGCKDGECVVNVDKKEGLDDVELWYSGDGSEPKPAECEDFELIVACSIPDLDVEFLNYWLKLDECEENFSHINNSEWGEEEVPECCEITDVSHVHYEGTPGVSRYLSFDLEFGCMPVSEEDEDIIIPGSAYIGADPQDIFWTDVECYYPSDMTNEYVCSSTGSVEQKESWTRVELELGECKWEVGFHTPAFFRGDTGEGDSGGCPSGQSMCGGSCCAGECNYGICQ